MQLASGYEGRRARIEIVPLIDVVFLLLVFFIYAMLSMTVYRGVRVELPGARGEPGDGELLIVTISADNALSVAGQPVGMEQAVSSLAARSRAGELPILVRGDRRADLGIAIALLAKFREAGVFSVAFQVREEE